MRKIFLLLSFCFLLQFSGIAQSYPGPYLSAGIDLGYNNGLGAQGFLKISNFTQDIPLSDKDRIRLYKRKSRESCRSKIYFY